MFDWQDISTSPEGVEVETKIDDKSGVRNISCLTRYGRLWWICEGNKRVMYVYYAPTHWRSPRPKAREE